MFNARFILTTLVLASFSATTTFAAPICRQRTSSGITPAQLLQIAPDMATCDPAIDFPEECRTAEQSAPFVNQGFADFNITTKGEKAAILSLMLFESGNFKFDINRYVFIYGIHSALMNDAQWLRLRLVASPGAPVRERET